MTDQSSNPTPAVELEVAIEGEGISPDDITIKHLTELLEATSAAVDAVAQDRGIRVVDPVLVAIRQGSAAYAMASPAMDWPPMVAGFYDAVRARGVGYGARVRGALGRLFKAGRVGGVRVRASGMDDARFAAPLHVSAPLDAADVAIEHTSELYGRVVGVNEFERGTVVRLELLDGGRRDLAAEASVAALAARLFGRTVRAKASARWGGERDVDRVLERLEAWSEVDLVDALDRARAELAERGVQIDADTWLRERD